MVLAGTGGVDGGVIILGAGFGGVTEGADPWGRCPLLLIERFSPILVLESLGLRMSIGFVALSELAGRGGKLIPGGGMLSVNRATLPSFCDSVTTSLVLLQNRDNLFFYRQQKIVLLRIPDKVIINTDHFVK